MAYDCMKDFMVFESLEDEERFIKLFQSLEETIRGIEEKEGNFSDFEIIQALDFIGFNFFRDSWEEFKKLEMNRDLSKMQLGKSKFRKLLN